MNLTAFSSQGMIGLVFVLVFLVLILVFAFLNRRRPEVHLRPITAFMKLKHAVGLAVEAGTRLHISLGRGGISGVQGGSAVIGLSILERISRAASVSDRPPVATSGEGTLAILSQGTLESVYRAINESRRYDPSLGQLSGLTPFSYAAGVLPLIWDEEISASFLGGNFGSEVALILDASERKGSFTLAGSDDVTGQAVIYATAEEPLVGEELYSAGAYLKAGPLHLASVRTQDVFRWLLILGLLGGAALKFMGVL